jgi:hypothetical protein
MAARMAERAKKNRGNPATRGTPECGDTVRVGVVRTPRKVRVTDRRITAGRKESAITEFAQNRHEFTGDYVRRTPVKRSPVDNGASNHVRIAQLPTGTKPVWR